MLIYCTTASWCCPCAGSKPSNTAPEPHVAPHFRSEPTYHSSPEVLADRLGSLLDTSEHPGLLSPVRTCGRMWFCKVLQNMLRITQLEALYWQYYCIKYCSNSKFPCGLGHVLHRLWYFLVRSNLQTFDSTKSHESFFGFQLTPKPTCLSWRQQQYVGLIYTVG